ncbi:MAG: hypothetical protein EA341_13840, partial [Mongoliibacter sp.]|uniref:MBG domain-containing protein n=1 Tax=Mongoliibacter sp. TaxID=2022438 RepID=UPI0012F048C2
MFKRFNWFRFFLVLWLNLVFCANLIAQQTVSQAFFHPSYGYPDSVLEVFGSDFNINLTVRIGESDPCEIISVSEDQKSMRVRLPSDISSENVLIYSGEDLLFESLGPLAVITPPLFLSTPILEVHYNNPYSYSIINDFVGNSDSNIFPDSIPTWLNHYQDTLVVNGDETIEYKNFKPVQFGDFGTATIGGVAEDPFGNAYVIRSDGTEIFKVDKVSGNTELWKSGLPRLSRGSSISTLYISDDYLFLPLNNSRLDRILLSDSIKSVQPLVGSGTGGTYSLAQYGGGYYLANFQNQRIERKLNDNSLELILGSVSRPTGISFENNNRFYLSSGPENSETPGQSILFYNLDSLNASPRLIFSSSKIIGGINKTQNQDFFVALWEGGLVRYYPEKDSLAQISLTDTENVRSISNSGRGSVIYSNFNSDKLFKLQNWSLLAGTPKKSDVGLHKVILRSNNDAGDGFQEFFIRVIDTIPPTLIEVHPEHERIHVPLDTKLKLTFDEEIGLGNGGRLAIFAGSSSEPLQIFDLNNAEDLQYLSITEDQLSLEVVLKEKLPYDKKITIAVENDSNGNFIEDLSQNPFAGFSFESDTWHFFTKKLLTINPDLIRKTYGEEYVFSNQDFTLQGLEEGDPSPLIVISSEGSLSSALVGQYAINISQITGLDEEKYDFLLEESFLEVEPALLTIQADDKQKTYGEENPPLTFSYIGLVNGDSRIAVEPEISTSADAGSVVGTYGIRLSGGSDVNYDITLVDGTLTVSRRSLTITADDKQKTYGEENPPLTFSYSGLVNGDSRIAVEPEIATMASASSGAGNYAITLSGGSDDNYDFTLVDGTLTVGMKSLTITADDKQKTYGEENPSLTFSYTGLVNGDSRIAIEPEIATSADAGSVVGTYAIRLSGGSDDNYDITLMDGTLTVGRKSLTITADDKQKTYGAENPPLTFSYTGLVNGDKRIAVEPDISTEANRGSVEGSYAITLSGGLDDNYDITLVDGTLTVGRKTLIITADDNQKTYGEENPPLTFSYTGLVNGDSRIAIEPKISTSANTESVVGAYAITLSGGSDDNYDIVLVDGTLTVGKRTLTITADDKQKTYGEENPPLTFSYTGLVNGDSRIALEPQIATKADARSGAGNYAITLSGGS